MGEELLSLPVSEKFNVLDAIGLLQGPDEFSPELAEAQHRNSPALLLPAVLSAPDTSSTWAEWKMVQVIQLVP